jgi:hypothetical protein
VRSCLIGVSTHSPTVCGPLGSPRIGVAYALWRGFMFLHPTPTNMRRTACFRVSLSKLESRFKSLNLTFVRRRAHGRRQGWGFTEMPADVDYSPKAKRQLLYDFWCGPSPRVEGEL